MVPSWPNTKRPPPNSTRTTPHQLPSNGIRSRRSFCCQIKNTATGGINRQWLYSGSVIHDAPMTQIPSQNNQRLNMPTVAVISTGPQVRRQTKPVAASRSNEFEDIFIIFSDARRFCCSPEPPEIFRRVELPSAPKRTRDRYRDCVAGT